MISISHSELACFTQCRRKWALNYYWQFQPNPAREAPVGSAQLGSRIHLALEAHYGYHLDPLQALEVIYQRVLQERPDFTIEIEKEASYARTMVEGYLDWAASEGADVDLEVIATETEQQAEIPTADGESFMLRGKLDQLIRRQSDGALLFRDWKTVGTLHKADNLILQTQMRTYAMLQALLAPEGQRADGGLYTMLLRSKRTARASGPFYSQVEVHFNRHDHRATWLRVREIGTEILRARRRLAAGEDHHSAVYPNPASHCDYMCPFKLECPLMDDGSRASEALKTHFIRADPYSYYSSEGIEAVRAALSTSASA